MKHAPFNHGDDDDDEDEDEESAEEDASEEELLIADPDAFGKAEAWRRQDTLIAGLCIVGWYTTSLATIIANKLLLQSKRLAYPFFACFVYMLVKWLLSRVLLLAQRRPPLEFCRSTLAWYALRCARLSFHALHCVPVGVHTC